MINYAIKNLTVIYLFRFFYLIDTIIYSFIRVMRQEKDSIRGFFVVFCSDHELWPKYRISSNTQHFDES